MQTAPMAWALNWWAAVIRGVVAIIFGVLAIAQPGFTFVILVLLFGAYALVDGIFAIISAIQQHAEHGRLWGLLLEGIAGIVLGLVTFFFTMVAVATVVYVIAAWAIVTGILELVAAVRLRQVVAGEFWLILAGVASIIFGIVIFLNPAAGVAAIGTIIGVYTLIFGILMIGLGLRLRGMQ